MKKSKTAYDFFDGRLSDRKNSVRLYGFDEAVPQKLADHRDNGESVLLSNCEVKQNLRRKARILKSRSGALSVNRLELLHASSSSPSMAGGMRNDGSTKESHYQNIPDLRYT